MNRKGGSMRSEQMLRFSRRGEGMNLSKRPKQPARLCVAVLTAGLLLAPGAAHATTTGTVVAWGCGGGADFGQCSVPSDLSGVTAVDAGGAHSLALKSDGTVVAWGCGG